MSIRPGYINATAAHTNFSPWLLSGKVHRKNAKTAGKKTNRSTASTENKQQVQTTCHYEFMLSYIVLVAEIRESF